MTSKNLRFVLILAFVIGLIIDIVLRLLNGENIIGFLVAVPIMVLLLFYIFNVFKIKNKFLIVFLTALCFFLGTMLTLFLALWRMGGGGDMGGLTYFIFAIPSVVLGLIFGFILAKRINQPLI